MERTDSLEKTNAGKDWRQEEKGMTEDKTVWCHYWLNRHDFEQTPVFGDACCIPWVCKKSDTTEWLTWTELNTVSQITRVTIYNLHILLFRFWTSPLTWKSILIFLRTHPWPLLFISVPITPFKSVCMRAKLLQFCLTLCDPMDYCSLPGSSAHRIF